MTRTILTAVAVMFVSQTLYAEERTPTLNMVGVGTVQAQPDEGYITLGVQTKAETSAEAVRANTKSMTNVYAAMEELGIEKKDIATLSFNVEQLWRYEKVDDRNNRRVPDGFQVSNIVRITVCELDTFGDVLDKVTQSGANRVQSISFGSSKKSELLDEARAKAVADAIRKAGIIVDGLGVNLGMVVAVSEQRQSYGQPKYARMDMAAAAAESAPVPVSGGSLSFSVSVSVTWNLEPERQLFRRGVDPRPFEGRKPDKPRKGILNR